MRYPGIASQASFFLNGTEPAFGSIFQIGWAYAIGIAFAIITCGATSGGHFNPAITLVSEFKAIILHSKRNDERICYLWEKEKTRDDFNIIMIDDFWIVQADSCIM